MIMRHKPASIASPFRWMAFAVLSAEFSGTAIPRYRRISPDRQHADDRRVSPLR
jgi:hypothetical protein